VRAIGNQEAAGAGLAFGVAGGGEAGLVFVAGAGEVLVPKGNFTAVL
jgi:hypothetical protein